MERIFNKAENHKKAEQWDILQQARMSPEERMKVAKELKKDISVITHPMFEAAENL